MAIPGKALANTVTPAIAGEWNRSRAKRTSATDAICPAMRPSRAAPTRRGSPRTSRRLR